MYPGLHPQSLYTPFLGEQEGVDERVSRWLETASMAKLVVKAALATLTFPTPHSANTLCLPLLL